MNVYSKSDKSEYSDILKYILNEKQELIEKIKGDSN